MYFQSNCYDIPWEALWKAIRLEVIFKTSIPLFSQDGTTSINELFGTCGSIIVEIEMASHEYAYQLQVALDAGIIIPIIGTRGFKAFTSHQDVMTVRAREYIQIGLDGDNDILPTPVTSCEGLRIANITYSDWHRPTAAQVQGYAPRDWRVLLPGEIDSLLNKVTSAVSDLEWIAQNEESDWTYCAVAHFPDPNQRAAVVDVYIAGDNITDYSGELSKAVMDGFALGDPPGEMLSVAMRSSIGGLPVAPDSVFVEDLGLIITRSKKSKKNNAMSTGLIFALVLVLLLVGLLSVAIVRGAKITTEENDKKLSIAVATTSPALWHDSSHYDKVMSTSSMPSYAAAGQTPVGGVQVKYKAADQGMYLNTDGGWGGASPRGSMNKGQPESPSYIDIGNSFPAAYGSPDGVGGSHFYPGSGGGGGGFGQVFGSGSNGLNTADYVGAQTRAGAANPQYHDAQDRWTLGNTKPKADLEPEKRDAGKYQAPDDARKRQEFDMTAAFETSNATAPPGGELPDDVVDELKSIFMKADSGNGDHMGVLSKTEIKFRLNMKQIKDLLVRLNLLMYFDQDGDGELTYKEIMDAMDSDGDGNISLAEFIGTVRKAMADSRSRQTAAVASPAPDEFAVAADALSDAGHPNANPPWPQPDEFEGELGGLNPLPAATNWSSPGSAGEDGLGLQPANFQEGNNLQSGYAIPEDPGYLEPAPQESGEVQWAERASSDLPMTPASNSRPSLEMEEDDEFGFAENALMSHSNLSGGEFGAPLSTITENNQF